MNLDHRLTKIEGAILEMNSSRELRTQKTQSQLAEIASLLKAQNGRIGTLELWRTEIVLSAARTAGIIEGRAGIRKQEAAMLLAFLTVASSLGGLVVALIEKL